MTSVTFGILQSSSCRLTCIVNILLSDCVVSCIQVYLQTKVGTNLRILMDNYLYYLHKVHDIAAAARAHLYLSDQVFSLYQVNRPKNFEDSLETILYFTPGHEDIISVVRGIRKDGLSLF